MPPKGGLDSIEHRRILAIMGLLGAVSGIACMAFVSVRFGLGILLGIAVAFVNYFWLKRSLKKLVENTTEGEKPRISTLRYLGRYLVLGTVIAIVYVSEIVPIVPFMLGIAGFGFAVVADGLIRIFTSFYNRKEI